MSSSPLSFPHWFFRWSLLLEHNPLDINQFGQRLAEIPLVSFVQDTSFLLAIGQEDIDRRDDAATDAGAILEGDGVGGFAGGISPAGILLQVRTTGDVMPFLFQPFPENFRLDPGNGLQRQVAVHMGGFHPHPQRFFGRRGNRSRQRCAVAQGNLGQAG